MEPESSSRVQVSTGGGAPALNPAECAAVLDHVLAVMDTEAGLAGYAAEVRSNRGRHAADCAAEGDRARHDCVLAASVPRELVECGIRVSLTSDEVDLFGGSTPTRPRS